MLPYANPITYVNIGVVSRSRHVLTYVHGKHMLPPMSYMMLPYVSIYILGQTSTRHPHHPRLYMAYICSKEPTYILHM
jgi:hypothetical protein